MPFRVPSLRREFVNMFLGRSCRHSILLTILDDRHFHVKSIARFARFGSITQSYRNGHVAGDFRLPDCKCVRFFEYIRCFPPPGLRVCSIFRTHSVFSASRTANVFDFSNIFGVSRFPDCEYVRFFECIRRTPPPGLQTCSIFRTHSPPEPCHFALRTYGRGFVHSYAQKPAFIWP